MKRMNIDLSKLGESAPIILGGIICFFTAFSLLAMSQWIIHKTLFTFGCMGLLAFEETVPAIVMSLLVLVYLPSGFFAGLYTGYKIKENLRVILIYPPLIGFAALMILRIYLGGLDLSLEGIGRDALIPLVGNVVGSYLGGYTMNWEMEEEEI